jgi:hypothetical protein
MSLDIHVMPIWRFWAGEYSTAAERFAASTGTPISRIGQPKALYQSDQAKQLAKGVRRWIEQQTGQSEAWSDDGDIVFSEQFQFDAIHAVRAYAAHTESSEEPFTLTEEFQSSAAVRRVWAGVPTDFPHLILHEDNAGFYVPVDFELPMKLMGQPPTIGSSVQLMIELAALRRRLGDFPDYAARQQGAIDDEPHPGLAWVKHGVAFLYQACWLSVQSRLPIVIDG